MTFISPFTDFGFKKIFGEEPNKDILIDFLNQVLALENVQIKDLTYKKNEFMGVTDIDRRVIFDLYCENEKGEKFIVEMQKTEQVFFKDRAVFYSTFPIQEQAVKGEWNYELKSVYCIAILGFMLDEEAQDGVIRQVKLTDQKTKKVFYEKLTYIFIQIPGFTKTIDELENRLDQWLYVLKHLDTFERIPEPVKDKIFQKVFEIAELSNLDKKEQRAYQESLKHHRDLYSTLTTAQEKGYKQAEEEFGKLLEQEKQRAEQLEQRAEQLEQRAEQLEKEKIEAIKKMLESGICVSQIMDIFQVNEEFLKKYNLL